MAAHCGNVANARKKKLPSMDELLEQGNAILEKGKRRKPLHYEFSTDPTTGRRNCKNSYDPNYYNCRSDNKNSCGTSTSYAGEYIDTMFQGKGYVKFYCF